MSKLLRNALIIWALLTLLMTYVPYSANKDGTNYANPIYRTAAEQRNPTLLFFRLLPFGALSAGVIVGIGATLVYFTTIKKEE